MSLNDVLIVAGEASGDAHAARLVSELRRLVPSIRLYGTGGDRMRDVGVEILFDASTMNVIGFAEVVRKYSYLRSVFRRLVETISERRPRLAILVDYPGFNLRLAAELAARNIPVVYYIAPQVWAWKEGRVRQLRKYVDSLIVAFPFEVEYFRRHAIEALFFGHPLVDTLYEGCQIPKGGRPPLTEHPADSDAPPVVGYLPGSRSDEIRRHMPFVVEIINYLGPGYRHVVQRASTVPESMLDSYRDLASFTVESEPYHMLSIARAALVKSGTSTIEATLFGVPYAVFYRTSPLSYQIAKRLVHIGSIAMANIIAGRPVVREFVQDDVALERVGEEMVRLLTDGPYRADVQRGLAEVTGLLGEPGAAKKAAQFIMDRYWQ